MALFNVPGWSVPSAAPSQSSQKRKRPAHDGDKIPSANLEKLMNKLKSDKSADGDSPRAPKRRRRSGSDAGEKGDESSRSQSGKGIAEWGSRRREKKPSTSMISGPKKMKGTKNNVKPVEQTASIPALTSMKLPAGQTNFTFKAKSPPASAGLTSLQKDMKHSLDGARFRCVREHLLAFLSF
jgi:ribosomal RNA-processing protein 8